MADIDSYLNTLMADSTAAPSTAPGYSPRRFRYGSFGNTKPRLPRVPRPDGAPTTGWQQPRPTPVAHSGHAGMTKPATSKTPASTAYSAKNPPPGFTSSQWAQLLKLSQKNTTLAGLIKSYTGSLSAPQPDQAWRRQLPTDVTQLQRQLSFNAGEIGMPGGYVGALQMPSYQTTGSQNPAINNPNMATYGQQPGYGEATFYQQSMKGGMAPIAAMSPLGVPEGWNPGGTSSSDYKSQLEKYLQNLQGQSGGGRLVGTTVTIDGLPAVYIPGGFGAGKNHGGF